MGSEVAALEVVLGGISDDALRTTGVDPLRAQRVGSQVTVTLSEEGALEPLLQAAIASGAKVRRVQPARYSLEDLFLREARTSSADQRAPER
jgi:ABC-2 type transport system ATP-binding protein